MGWKEVPFTDTVLKKNFYIWCKKDAFLTTVQLFVFCSQLFQHVYYYTIVANYSVFSVWSSQFWPVTDIFPSEKAENILPQRSWPTNNLNHHNFCFSSLRLEPLTCGLPLSSSGLLYIILRNLLIAMYLCNMWLTADSCAILYQL